VTARRLAEPCRALLGAVSGPVLVVGPDGPAWSRALRALGLAMAVEGAAAGGVVALLGERGDAAARARMLATMAERLVAGAPVVLVDHNRPRAFWRRPAGWLALLARGLPPSRDRHPAARELAAAGFTVECLRLAAGERVQHVRARRDA
jgi:hypothetical protein